MYLELITLGSLLPELVKVGKLYYGLELYRELYRVKGLFLYDNMCAALIDGMGKAGMADEAILLYEEMLKKGVGWDVYVVCSLIDSLCKVGRVFDANRLFEESTHRGVTFDIVAYNVLIDGLYKADCFRNSWNLFKEMNTLGHTPNVFHYNSFFHALELSNMEKSFRLLGKILARGCKMDTIT